jgi:hypothetical protein
MSGNQEIRDAVRQLGRAVGTLVRAVAGVVRRTPSAAVEPPAQSGPPQAWLDLVAETDPDWLARSEWADRDGQKQTTPARRSGSGRRANTARTAPSHQPSPTEELWPDAVPAEPRTAPTRRPKRTSAADETPLPESERAHDRRTVDAEPRPRRLVPVDSQEQHVQDEPARRVRLSDPSASTTPDAQALGTTTSAHEADRATTHWPMDRVPDTAKDMASPEQAAPRPYKHSDVLRPVPLQPVPYPAEVEPVRTERAPRRPASLLPAHVQELPGTWTPAPRHAPAASERKAASAPSWPALPPAAGLDEASSQAGQGLVAQLWQAEDRPDTLTTAQRRS